MTYCVGMLLQEGLLFASDSRTNAGVDQINTFRKVTVFEQPGERVIVLQTAGNLAVSQAVVNHLQEAIADPSGPPSLVNARTMFEAAQRVGDAVSVVTVHQDENETAALDRMADLGVRLPVLQDGRRSIAAALGVPNVMPATVVLRADGSVAAVLPEPFTSADGVAAAVESALR